MKTSKKIISLVLCAVMVASTFLSIGPIVSFKSEAAEGDVTLGGITQTRVVSNYESLYRSYQKRFFNGEETNWPTDFVIPGLSSADDYTPQGMTYWKAKEWILISAYDASGQGRNSVIYALDIVSTKMVAVFKIQNADGSVNLSHGGGIAASEYNFYYADSGSKISYIPLSEMDVAPGTTKNIKLRDSIDLNKELNSVATSYCCYDEGVLWTGNFYISSDDRYNKEFASDYKQTLMGYRLAGNSSAEEWYYLKNGYNLVKLNSDDPTNNITAGAVTYRSFNVDGANAEVRGTVTTDTALSEVTPSFATVNLTEGKKYKIEFIADNNLTDMYMFAPNSGGHCNVKQSQQSKITNLGNGKYHYQMIFTAGLRPTGADSGWPTTQSTTGTYTGTYTIRYDQDSIPAGGRSFNITDFSITEYVEPQGFTPNSKYEGIGCQGNPTYVVLLNMDKIQYAMVDKGKIYISRSWSRTESTNHSRDLVIGDIDLTMPGDETRAINGRTRPVHIVKYADCMHFGGDSGASTLNQMLYMGEALCVINDYLYMFGEGAGWTYNGKEDNKCTEPIDVLWKIDQYAIQGLNRPHDDVASVEYEKVNSLSEINNVDEYIIVYESAIKDPVTQRNILYLLDSYGGYNNTKLPKKASANGVTVANTGDSRGIIGYEIRNYSVDGTKLVINAEDDAHKSLHWQFESGSSTSLKLRNRDLYFAKHPYLYVGDSMFALTTIESSTMKIKDWGNGKFTFYGNGENHSIWCNDGSVPASVAAYTDFYSNHNVSGYAPNYHNQTEIPGTFHVTNSNQPALPTNDQQGMTIYKRVIDPYASSYETQVYTDLQAELQSNGTYTITLETYATNALQYQRVKERPTDFIFVLDSTGSMLDDKDCSGYIRYGASNTLSAKSVAGNSDSIGDSGAKTGVTGSIYYMTEDGVYRQLYVDASARGDDGEWYSHKYYKYFWLYYKKDGVNVYYNPSTKGWQTTKPSESEVGKSYGNSDEARAKNTIYTGVHYEKSNSLNRLQAVQNTVEMMTYKIAEKAKATGLDHRIAICSFGTDGSTTYGYQWTGTNMYTNDGTEISYPKIKEENYKNAFFSVSQFGTIRSLLYEKMEPLGHSYPSYGLDMASKMIDNSEYEYDINGTRSAVVIVISDGVPGWEENANRNLDVTKQTANDTLANGARSLKRNGAYIYSVLLGNDSHFSEADFSTTDFMKYLSSEYTGSKSLDDPGPHNNREEVNYYMQVPSGSSFNLDNVLNQLFDEVVANSNNAIASLTGEAVLREHLTDAFDLTNAVITYKTAKSKCDGIGRITFEDPVETSDITGTIDRDTNNIEVTGFDYSERNVSEYNSRKGNGAKLVVEITGVIAKHDEELQNTSINDTNLTALYENGTRKIANQPVKKFPTYHFSIPEYTYYLDYGIPMYDSDINGTLCSVDSTLQKQSTYRTELDTGNMGIKFKNGNQDMVYTLNSQAGLTENLSKGYVLIKRDDGTYDWFRLNIVPASTVYYEENKTDTLDGTQSFTEWTQSGSPDSVHQDLSAKDDVFGSDETYFKSKDTFSLGTHKEVTVSSAANRSDTQTFTFTGTGFDLYSACGTNTGIQTVTVKQHQADGTMKIVKVFMVDTYYNDATYGTLYQVPIVHYVCDYGTYTVETTAAYYSFAGGLKTQSVTTDEIEGTEIEATSAVADIPSTDALFKQVGMDELVGQEVEVIWMDENSIFNGGTGAESSTLSTQAGEGTKTLVNYLDGFRIYNPVDYNEEYIVSEQNATYYSVMDAISAGSFGGDSFAGYLEGGSIGSVFADYLSSGGPKYEVYLKPGNSIAFRFKATDFKNNYPRVMVSVRSASGGAAKAKFASTADLNHAFETPVLGTSETFYDVTDKALGNGSDGSFVLTVTNTGSGLLAVDNLKLVNATLAPFSGVSLNSLNALISTQAVEIENGAFSVETPEAPTFVDAPADNPNIDPAGSIPTTEEFNKQEFDKDKKALFEMIVDFLMKIVEFIKHFIQVIPTVWTRGI